MGQVKKQASRTKRVETKLPGQSGCVPVRQPPGSMGCGVACVAFLTNCTYEQALEQFFRRDGVVGNPEKGGSGYDRGAMVKALKYAEKEYKIVTFGGTSEERRRAIDFPHNAIVFIRGEGYEAGHYLVRHHEGWMDPLQNKFRRKLLGRPVSWLAPGA